MKDSNRCLLNIALNLSCVAICLWAAQGTDREWLAALNRALAYANAFMAVLNCFIYSRLLKYERSKEDANGTP